MEVLGAVGQQTVSGRWVSRESRISRLFLQGNT